MSKTYSWSTAKCVRYNEDFAGENHPCYWCGVPPEDMLGKELIWCKQCGGFLCPHCGYCWCNVKPYEFEVLKTLRNRYCCNWFSFKTGMELTDYRLLTFVPGFKKALDYCREKKGFKE